MYIEQALIEASQIKPIDKVIDFEKTPFIYKATKKLIYPFGYEFELDVIEGYSWRDLNENIRRIWNVEPNYTQN